MLHPFRSPGSAATPWPVIAAALAFGLLECLALARCRWRDWRAHKHPAA